MPKIKYTQITADCEMTKTFRQREDGGVDSTAIAHMTSGQAQIVELDDLSQFRVLLQMLQSNQAITCGVPAVGNTPLTTRAGTEFRIDAVARTNESFIFPYEGALCPIDVDADDTAFPSVQAVLDALEAASPWLRHVHRVARPSSSSYVAGRGLRGVHVYLAVTRGTDIPAVGERLKIEQWAAGYGHVKISKSGALLVRQLSDALVYQPSRLMFEAPPVCHGLERCVPDDQAWVERPPILQPGRPARWKSPEGWLDAGELPPIKDIDKRRFETAVKGRRAARLREAKRVALDYQLANAMANGLDAEAGTRYGLMATRALGDSALPPSWPLAVKVGDKLTHVKVADVLANLASALGLHCVDPFDTWRTDLTLKHATKAEIVTMGDKAGVWSHKLQQFFAFSTDAIADLDKPIELAAEKLCNLLEYPENSSKTAPLVNVVHALRELLRETGTMPRFNVAADCVDTEDVPALGELLNALSRVGCQDTSKTKIETALELLAFENRYDPWKDAMLALPAWDGVPRLDSIFVDVCGAPPSDALRLTGQVLFAAIVRKQFHPGAPSPVTPVLIGGPNVGKSQFVQALARSLGAPLPSAIKFDHDQRRMSMRAARSLVAELSELAGLDSRENEDVKSWLTDEVDTYRKPYDKEELAHPRRFVLLGTANKHETNRDETGNRRFMPVHVTQPIDPNWVVELPQLFAEAKARFADDESAYIKLICQAPAAVLSYNEQDMRRGVGTPIDDASDLLPDILRQLVRQHGPIVRSSAIRAALDLSASGRQIHARNYSRWMLTRGWVSTRRAEGIYYEAPKELVDRLEDSSLPLAHNPFSNMKGALQ